MVRDEVDREMEAAEEQATRPDLPRGDTDLTTPSDTTDSSYEETQERNMGRIATAYPGGVGAGATVVGTRTRALHPVETYRVHTHALQHSATVGAGPKKQSSDKPLPEFGGGKPFPPDLPPYEDYVVEFDGHDDPIHPQNWPLKKKLFLSLILAWTCICSTFNSSVFSPSTRTVAHVFHIGGVPATLTTSLYVLGYAFGPLIWGPFSELKGRVMPIQIAMVGFTIFAFSCGASFNFQTLTICRFFAGLFGSAPLAIVAAVFSDMFDNRMRGTAVVCFCACVFIGPMMGPFIGGFIQTSPVLGWRWNQYLPGFMGGISCVLNFLYLEETYAPVVLVNKAAELRRLTLNWGIHAKQEEIEVDFGELLKKNFTRPLRLLFTEPIILFVAIYMSFVYGLIYLFLTAFALVFQGVHGFTPGLAGLPFFAVIVGILLVASYIVFYEVPRYNKKLENNGGIPVPEWRLWPVVIGGISFTIGLFWFGWTGYNKSIHWIAPTLSGIAIGFGILAIFMQLFNYIIDSYLMFAASAISAMTFARSIAAAGFPLFAKQMFNGMGIQWAATLLAVLSMMMIPVPLLFMKYGKALRAKSKFAPTMKAKIDPTEDEDEDLSHFEMPALVSSISAAHVNTDRLDRAVTRTTTTMRIRTGGSDNTLYDNTGASTDLEKQRTRIGVTAR